MEIRQSQAYQQNNLIPIGKTGDLIAKYETNLLWLTHKSNNTKHATQKDT